MDPYSAALDLLRRLPPTNVSANLDVISRLCPDIAEDLAVSVDQPLQLKSDGENGKEYLCCDYNRDGESYRSPWSNAYSPPLADGAVPSETLRELEVGMNEAFDTYREMYFEGGSSSVYLWDLEEGGFAGVVLLKKALPSATLQKGSWDSIHVFEVRERSRQAHYSLTSTILLYLGSKTIMNEGDGDVSLSGTMTRQVEQDQTVTSPSQHVVNIGRMIEDIENKQRNSLSEVYFGKTKDIVAELRSIEGSEIKNREANLRRELLGAFGRRAPVE
ncbi:hypothetical protein FFLO_06007 [Filobasidium floriforme]|uniref:F-actin-capping protein subunit beta n=1 Tax=Filobasidium floriforme TaxID=5210 RepID=A0A8K0JI29_9TREE|nr:hypothetical protein FFLO_06007 [Filobasidium floriforme]